MTDDEYEAVKSQVLGLQDQGIRLEGRRSWRNFHPIETDVTPFAALVCVDNEGSRIINEAGEDVTPDDREADYTLRLGFVTDSGRMLLDTDETWTEQSAC